MKTAKFLITMLVVSVLSSCGHNAPMTYSNTEGEENGTFAKLTIEGMMCERACGTKIAKELLNVPGVTSAEVDFEEGRAENFAIVRWNEKQTEPEVFVEAVDRIADGKLYKVESVEIVSVKKSTIQGKSGSEKESVIMGELLPVIKVFQFLEQLIVRPQ